MYLKCDISKIVAVTYCYAQHCKLAWLNGGEAASKSNILKEWRPKWLLSKIEI